VNHHYTIFEGILHRIKRMQVDLARLEVDVRHFKGVQLQKGPKIHMRPEELEHARQLYVEQYMTMQMVAQQMGYCEAIIKREFEQAGIKIRGRGGIRGSRIKRTNGATHP